MRAQLLCVLSFAAIISTGCGNEQPSAQDAQSAQIRVMQGSSDLGSVDVVINSQTFAQDLSWHNAFPLPTTSYSNVAAGSVQFQEFPANTRSSPVVSAQLSLSPNSFYTLLTVGEQSTGSLATMVLSDDHTAPTSGKLKMRLIQGASTIGNVDVYTTSGPGDAVPTTPILSSFAYKSSSGYMLFAGSGAQICINPAGSHPTSMNDCLFSFQYKPNSQAQTAVTLLLLDPNTSVGGVGSFTSPVAFASLPY